MLSPQGMWQRRCTSTLSPNSALASIYKRHLFLAESTTLQRQAAINQLVIATVWSEMEFSLPTNLIN